MKGIIDKWFEESDREFVYHIEQEKIDELKQLIKKEVDSKKIYPIDIFPEIHEELLEEINQELQNKFEFPLDRLSAHISRKILDGLSKKLIGDYLKVREREQ